MQPDARPILFFKAVIPGGAAADLFATPVVVGGYQGDFEAAGNFAKQAMIHASNNGMTLDRISLRVLMGTILLNKGDLSGRYLLLRAIDHADKIGYQLMVDRAQRALLHDESKKLISVGVSQMA